MRFLPTCLVLLAASPLGATDVYRWVDKDGVTHFSDQPNPGAEKIPLKAAPKPGSVSPNYAPSNSTANSGEPEGAQATAAAAAARFRYTSCAISNPAQDETFNSTDAVGVGIDLLPGYRAGDRVQVQLNGQRVADWPETSTSYLLAGLARGSYSLTVTVLGPDGSLMCAATPIGFHVLQPSLLSPGRKLAPKT
jgi:hypothetical protein